MNPYIAIARPDHWFKNIFMLPGIATALILNPVPMGQKVVPLAFGILSTCLVASANYVINEFLDRDFDKHHPTKHARPCARGLVNFKVMLLEYLMLAATGLGIAWTLGFSFLCLSVLLLGMGVLYNVKPMRTKDLPFMDVLSESINNPLRFMLGWAIIIPNALPPSSVLLAYWFGGAFLMSVKRFAEYRHIADPAKAGLYRRSFAYYTDNTLLLSSFFYALNSVFFLGIFLIKYKIEFVLSFPLFATLFTWYLAIGLKENSRTQNPEKLYREWPFMCFVAFLGIAVSILFFVHIPLLETLLPQNTY